MRNILFLLLISMALFSSHCKSKQNGVKTNVGPAAGDNETVKRSRLLKPSDKSYIKPDSTLEVQLSLLGEKSGIDSLTIQAGSKVLKRLGTGETNTTINFRGFDPGEKRLLVKVYFSDSLAESHSIRLRILSDSKIPEYSYKVVKTYPHDKGAYTQGLEYKNNFFYESTGNYGESSIRKTEIETGEILKYKELSSEFFGEGITCLNGKIYQITYREQVGFVYDENNFELQRKIFYQNKEGWGLCNDGTNILMSDGSHVIYFMDTSYFSVVRKIEVFDNNKEVNLLNELELINGVLYANRYTTDEIVMIDPLTGKVVGKIDMTGLLNPADRHSRIDYLNGIAYDSEKNRIFVTGKYWPKLYEVKFIKK